MFEIGTRRDENPSFVEADLGIVGNVNRHELAVAQDLCLRREEVGGALDDVMSEAVHRRHANTDGDIGLVALEDDLSVDDRCSALVLLELPTTG